MKRKIIIGWNRVKSLYTGNEHSQFLTSAVKYTICWILLFISSVKSALENGNATFTHSNIKLHRFLLKLIA